METMETEEIIEVRWQDLLPPDEVCGDPDCGCAEPAQVP